MDTQSPDHGRPRSDNLPDGMLPLPALPAEITDEDAAAKRAEILADEPAQEREIVLPFDADKLYALRLRVTAFADAAGAWKDIKAVSTKEQAERLTDFQRGAQGLAKQVEAQRVADKKPHDDRADAVQAAYKPLSEVLTKISAMMKAMMGDWLRAEQARLDAEAEARRKAAAQEADAARAAAARAEAANDVIGMVEAEAKAKEAEAMQKAADKPVKAKADSATGGGRAMGFRTQAYAEITNISLVFVHFRTNPKVADLLQSLADAAIRAGETVPGADRKERQVVA